MVPEGDWRQVLGRHEMISGGKRAQVPVAQQHPQKLQSRPMLAYHRQLQPFVLVQPAVQIAAQLCLMCLNPPPPPNPITSYSSEVSGLNALCHRTISTYFYSFCILSITHMTFHAHTLYIQKSHRLGEKQNRHLADWG